MNLLLPASSLLWIIAPASTNNPSGSGQRTQNHLPNSLGALRVYTYGIWVNRRTKYIIGSHEFFNSETSFVEVHLSTFRWHFWCTAQTLSPTFNTCNRSSTFYPPINGKLSQASAIVRSSPSHIWVTWSAPVVCLYIDPTKIESIQNWPPLQYLKQLRNFLGLAGY